MTLQLVLESITSTPLDELVRTNLTAPLGMVDTFYNFPNRVLKPEILARIAPTEFQLAALGTAPSRPQPVWGTVHDENAWSLDGVSGHAGVFSTAYDLAIFGQMILNNGTYNGKKILEPSVVDLIFTNFNSKFPGNEHGLGFELNQAYWAGAMKGLGCAGHTGFTGTSIGIDRPSNTVFILLSNRVHPTRTWPSTNVARQNLGLFVARALGRNV
jgi:CubicO group peptidase (beta-lactamase class C family)